MRKPDPASQQLFDEFSAKLAPHIAALPTSQERMSTALSIVASLMFDEIIEEIKRISPGQPVDPAELGIACAQAANAFQDYMPGLMMSFLVGEAPNDL